MWYLHGRSVVWRNSGGGQQQQNCNHKWHDFAIPCHFWVICFVLLLCHDGKQYARVSPTGFAHQLPASWRCARLFVPYQYTSSSFTQRRDVFIERKGQFFCAVNFLYLQNHDHNNHNNIKLICLKTELNSLSILILIR